jgi:hypothetical protein
MTNTLDHLPQNNISTPEQDREIILNEAYEIQSRQTLLARNLSKTTESLYAFENLDPKDIINE